MENSQKTSVFALMRKIPGGIIIVPLFIGVIVNTIAPDALKIGGFTTGLFSTGTSCLLGLFLLLNGASINVRNIGMPFYKGFVLTLIKFVLGVALGLAVSTIFGPAGFLGVTPMAIIAALTNSAGGEYLAIAQQFGDDTDAGAISILSLNDGPFFTMIAMGAAGMASIPFTTFVATLVPLIIGIVWGNLDAEFRKHAANAVPIVTFFMMIPIGAGMSLRGLVSGGIGGVVLAIISALSAFVFYFVYLVLPAQEEAQRHGRRHRHHRCQRHCCSRLHGGSGQLLCPGRRCRNCSGDHRRHCHRLYLPPHYCYAG